jgi:3-phosphoshikimate 1-carboxyvinyltransferase
MKTQPQALEILPTPSLSGEIEVPGSKSYTNRALLVSALAKGSSRLLRPLHSDDTLYMAQSLGKLGVRIEEQENGQVLRVSGSSGAFPVSQAELFVGNAGTAMRFLAAAVCIGQGEYRLDGNERMRERPIQDLIDGLAQLGCDVRSEAGNGCPPVRIRASGIRGGICKVPGSRSSQFFSALLMAAPYAQSDTTIRVVGDLVSKPYVDITLQVMRDFGVSAQNDDYRTFRVPCGQVYVGRECAIEPDASNACYFWAAAAIAGGPVLVKGLTRRSAQGDVGFVDVLRRMGCGVLERPDGIEVRGCTLRAGEFDLGDMPDTAQTLAVVALFAQGATTIRNIGNLRIKETDRITALANELSKLGASVEQGPDWLSITPGELHGTLIETYDDHRMAMSFALAGARIPGVEILNPGCVAKTYPGFFDAIRRIGLDNRPGQK